MLSVATLKQFSFDWQKALTFAAWGACGGIAGGLIGELVAHAPASFAATIQRVGFWFGIVGACIALALLFAQTWYFRRAIRLQKSTISGSGFGFLAGFSAGAAAQIVYGGIGPTEILRVICWGIAGALLGAALSFRIPNLGRKRGLCGGLVGGLLGGCLFILLTSIFSVVLGRLGGLAAIGFCIGLMIILAEAMFREAWLEISYSEGEKRTVSLGSTPVRIGSDGERCIVFAQHAPPVALTYRLEQGRIILEDGATGETQYLKPGDHRQLAKINIKVCATGETIPSDSLSLGKEGALRLYLTNGVTIMLSVGVTLNRKEFPGLDSDLANEIIAEVKTNPSDASILGLCNLSRQSWSAIMPDGSPRKLDPGRTIRLAKGMTIDFGTQKGEVR